MDELLDRPVTVSEHVVRRTFGGETIVLNLQSGQYHGLNDTASAMLDRIEAGARPRAVAAEIAGLAGVPVGTVEADLRALLSGLLERGLVAVGDDGG